MPLQTSIPRFRPVIRVFVSSTFSDMKHERNALQAEVFPKLEHLCLTHGFQFEAIDLRWGVSTEAGLDHRTMRICFDELRRAQEISPEPNFLILLGDRYGWRPLPEAISHAEFEELATAARTGGDQHTPLPGAHGKTAVQVLEDWYRCDKNIVPQGPSEADPDRGPLNYILQPRTQNLRDGRDYTRRTDDPTKDTQDWLEIQGVLWRLVNAAFPATGRWLDCIDWPRHVAVVNDPVHPKPAIPQLARFQASATEQEIWCGALSAAHAERHVIACFRQITNRDDFTAAEAKEFFDVSESGFDATSARRQADLKTAIEQRLGENLQLPIPFSKLKRKQGNVLLDAAEADTTAFCNAVFERFRPIIERQIKEYWDNSAKDTPARATRELKIEQEEHTRFGRERGGKASFVGRNAELEAIQAYLNGDNGWPLAVHGSSGCGKTALLWRAYEDIPVTRMPIIRLIGTTPHSSDLRSLLGSLCQELRQRNPRAEPLPIEIKELRDEFSQHLQAATPEQPLILFLDALDQLSDADNGRLLSWLPLTQDRFGVPPSGGPGPAKAGTPNIQQATGLPPGSLPPHVKLVVSCLSDRATGDPAGQPYTELQRRPIPAENFINLDVLSETEARLLLFDRWLAKAGRQVSAGQRACIEQRLASPACRQPIFLKLLFEEVRLWRSYDKARSLGGDVPRMLARFFVRLRRRENHGRLLVNRVLGYLSASRHGLAENEILEILFADPEYRAKLNEATEQTRHELPPNAKRIPIALWSRLRFDLAPYLTERSAPGANVLTFYHRQFGEWVRASDLKSVRMNWRPHERLVDYFDRKADPAQDSTWKTASTRALEELPYHLAQDANVPRWERTVSDPLFVEGTCRAGLVFEFLRDVDDGLSRLQSISVQLMRKAVASSLRTITQHPEFCLSILCNRLLWAEPNGLIAQAAARAAAALDASGSWLQAASPLHAVESIPLDGSSGQAFITERKTFATVDGSGCLEIRSIGRGELLAKRTLPSRTLTALAVEPAQFFAAWLDRNGDIRAESSQNMLPGRERETEVAYPRDDAVIAVSREGDLVAWNPQVGKTTLLAAGIPFPLVVLRANPDGSRILFVAGDRPSAQTLGVVSKSARGWRTDKLTWNGKPVKYGCLNPDGTRALLIDSGRGMSIVEVANGAILASTQYEQRSDVVAWGAITACALGRGREVETAVVTTDKGQVWTWDWKLDRFTGCGNYKGLQEGDAVHLLEIVPEGSRIFLSTASRAAFFSTDGSRSSVPHSAAVADCTITESELVASVCREDRALKWWRFDGLAPLRSFPVASPRVVAADGNDDCVFLGTDNGWVYRFPAAQAPESKDVFRLFDHPVVNIVSDRPGVAIASSSQGLIERVDVVEDRVEWLFSHTSGHLQRHLLPRAGGAYITVRRGEYEGVGEVVSLGTGQKKETDLYKSAVALLVAASRDGEHVVIYDRALKDSSALRVFTLEGSKMTLVFVGEADQSVCAMHLLLDDRYLLLAQRDEPWLELRRLTPGLPLANVMELPSAPSCVSVRQDKIAIGFQSGDILCLRVRDTNQIQRTTKG